MNQRILKNFDFRLFAVVITLVIAGLFMVYSTTYDRVSLVHNDGFFFVKKQLIAVVVGLVGFALMFAFDYRIPDEMAKILYSVNIFMLAMVLFFGHEVNGAKSWIFGMQPAEFSKIILVVLFGQYLSQRESLDSYFDLIGPCLFMGLPILLIMLQPDLGTVLVFIFFTLVMLYMAGMPGRKLVLLLLIVAVLISGVFLSHHFFGTPLPIKEYQINRLTSFLNPERDPQGSGWNVIQAIIAVGSGQFFGKGYLQGTQGRLGYLPENHTDFIYAILCEELGFIGGFFVLLLYLLLIWRGLKIAMQARDKEGSLMAVGIVSMIFFHVFENVGMNIGIMPITGIPLPFISAGGSSMIANLIGVGILLNIWARRSSSLF